MNQFLFKMYIGNRLAHVALFSAVLTVLIPMMHFFSGPEAFSILTLYEGRVVKIERLFAKKNSFDAVLTLKSGKNESILLHYLVNRGDSYGNKLFELPGKEIRAWVSGESNKVVYHLVSEGKIIIDYNVRYKQLTGDPKIILIYVLVCFAIFIILSLIRYKQLFPTSRDVNEHHNL